jgi:glycosyltransferase involved in cell wall biosynthesis
MRVAIISGILHPRYGGPSSVVAAHARALSKRAEVEVFGVARADEELGIHARLPNAKLFPAAFPARWFRGRGLLRALCREAKRFDILHAHMLWDYPVFATWLASRRTGVPFVVTPHGSVSESWRYSAAHKMVYRRIFVERLLRDAACVHVLTEKERAALLLFCASIRTCVVPNGLEPSAFWDFQRETASIEKPSSQILYLGRIAQHKGLEMLIRAWCAIDLERRRGWSLVLAGPDYRGEAEAIRALAAQDRAKNSVRFVGFVEGEAKRKLLQGSACLALPSKSEALSMVMLEAAAARVPVIYSVGCGFPELASAGGGWEVSMAEQDWTSALEKIIGLPPLDRDRTGEAALRFAHERFEIDLVAQQLLTMYADCVKAGQRTSDR